MNKVLVGLILTIGVGVGSTSIALADGVVIPVSIKVQAFKKEIKSRGMNLDGGDNADGFVEDAGNRIKVITYKPVSDKQMDLIKEAAFKTVRN